MWLILTKIDLDQIVRLQNLKEQMFVFLDFVFRLFG